MVSYFKKISIALLLISASANAADDLPLNDHPISSLKREYGLKFEKDGYGENSRKWLGARGLFKFERHISSHTVLPDMVDLRPECPPVYDQLGIGSCTANAGGAAVAYILKNQEPPVELMPGRLFVYYNSRALEGAVEEDVGSTLADTVRSIAQYGVPPETYVPYIDDGETFKMRPSEEAYEHALRYTNLDNTRLAGVNQDAYTIKSILARKVPIIFGIQVYESFESDYVRKTGIVPMPDVKKEEYRGGHAMMLVGYNTSEKVFYVRNSWGEHWGQKGYCVMPEDYILSSRLADDFWKIEKIGAKVPLILKAANNNRPLIEEEEVSEEL